MTTESITTNLHLRRAEADAGPSFWTTLASEWSKIMSLRSSKITLGLGFGLSVGTAVVASVVMGETGKEWPGNPITFGLVGTIFALLIYSVFGVMAMAGEYTSGMIRLTLTATPDRRRVYLAKLLLVIGTTQAIGVVTTVSMFLVTQLVLSFYGAPTISLFTTDALRAVIGLGLVMPFYPTVGLALGVLLRSTAGAITATMALLWLPQILREFLLPSSLSDTIIRLTPSSGLDSMTVSHVADSTDFSAPAVGALIAATWLAIFIGASYRAFMRRDV
jgi:ABC-type transport system involved in multi-copper enzyme maturation permease subunit